MTDPERTADLLQKTAGGAGWTIAWRGATRILGFISTLILARILLPADFGLVALAMSFARAIDIFADLGVQDSLVRATVADRRVYDTAFTVNAIRGAITAAIVAATAAPFANFFGDERLFYVVLALGASVLVEAFENVGVTDFRRHFEFSREFQLSIFPRLAQVVITIALAFTGANYWSLVAGILTARVLQTIASYLMHPYRPRLSLVAWREIASFSIWTWFLSMARMIRGRGVVMIIGGMLNTTKVGVFTVGSEIATLPETELIGPLGRACFAGFSAARRAGLSVADTYLRIVASTLLIGMPASIGISAIGTPVVYVAFGANWLEAAPVVEIMAIAGIFTVITRISSTLFNAFGYLGPLFWITVAISILQFALMALFVWQWGLVGAAIAIGLATMIEQTILALLTFSRFAIKPTDLLTRTWRCLLASAAMTGFLAESGLGWSGSVGSAGANLTQIALASLSGAAVYAFVLLGVWLASGRPNGPEADMLELLKRAIARVRGDVSRRAAALWNPRPR